MKNKLVVFIAFQEQDNLGIGYLAAVLMNAGFEIKIIDFRLGKEAILEQLGLLNPLVVGFSIIFQYHITDFKELIEHLRRHRISAHFCAGGHYPSLRYRDLMAYIPQLDSVVLFEGEQTFLELVSSLSQKKELKTIAGLAYRHRGRITSNPLRPLAEDLDNFPPPARPPLKEYALGKKYATLVAGRGCVYDCSYCSIREFYSRPPGKIKRIRRPEMVVREMELLHEEKQCSLFMFQDDDFPVTGKKEKEWTLRFCHLLEKTGLGDKIMFKINCRPDEIDGELFNRMKHCGLFLVYVGLESGTDNGLRLMNKHTTKTTNLEAVHTIKSLGIEYDYGFMLFDPQSTFESLLANLDFLERIVADGSAPVTFCKMLPYAGTRIERELMESGRLKGSQGFMDYSFLEKRIDRLYDFAVTCFHPWICDQDGLLNVATWVRFYFAVFRKYFYIDPQILELERRGRKLIANSNLFLVGTIREMCHRFGSSDSPAVEDLYEEVQRVQSSHKRQIKNLIEKVERLSVKG